MLAALVALALKTSSAAADWTSIAEQLRSVGKTYEKWGITFKVEGSAELEAGHSPLPGGLEVTGEFETPESLNIHLATSVGEKHSLAFDLGGTFKISPEGNATEGNGAVYLEGSGLAATFKNSGEEGITFEGALEEAFYKLGIKLGKSDEGPLAFGLKLGPLSIDIDPTKYAKRLREMGPTFVKAAGQNIGGVTLSVDADAMAYALAGATAPPFDFLKSRLAISLKSLLAENKDSLGTLNDIEGVLIDDKDQDIFIVGSHDDILPSIPTERLATVIQCVYEHRMHPFISIDPQGNNFSLPHKARVGGIPDSLKNSSLIQSMLTADYSMKQLFVGTHSIGGIQLGPDLVTKYDAPFSPSRFWINPAPLRVGDVQVSTGPTSRFYATKSTPVVLTEPFEPIEKFTLTFGTDPAADLSRETELIEGAQAQTLTFEFRAIETGWPDSGFGAARQDLQLTNILSLLTAAEHADWLKALLHSVGQTPIPSVAIPDSFPALRSADFPIRGVTTHIEGGMTTDQDFSAPVAGSDSIVTDETDWTKAMLDLGPRRPTAFEPQAITAEDQSRRTYQEALTAFHAEDYVRAKQLATQAINLQPNSQDAAFLLLSSISKIDEPYAQLPDDEYDKAMTVALKKFPTSPLFLFLAAKSDLDQASRSILEQDKATYRLDAHKLLDRVIELQPGLIPAYELRAKIAHVEGRETDSIQDWSRAIELAPNLDYLYFGLAAVHTSIGKTSPAMDELNRALSINPRNMRAWFVKALLEVGLKDFKSALADLSEAVKVSPANWIGFDLLGQVQFLLNDDEGALASLNMALALVPKSTIALAQTASDIPYYSPMYKHVDVWEDFVQRCGDPRDVSAIALTWGLTSPPFDPLMPYLRGKASFHLKHWKDAARDLESCIPLLPNQKTEIQKLIKECKGQGG